MIVCKSNITGMAKGCLICVIIIWMLFLQVLFCYVEEWMWKKENIQKHLMFATYIIKHN